MAQGKRIQIIHSDNSSIDEVRLPGATILLGNIVIRHEGIKLKCKKAVHYKNENFIKAYGDVVLNQGDSVVQTSQYTEYNGNTQKALSWGNVVIKDSKMTLSTDTLNFDRSRQLLFYKYGATIKDSINVLTSHTGNYYLDNNKFQAMKPLFKPGWWPSGTKPSRSTSTTRSPGRRCTSRSRWSPSAEPAAPRDSAASVRLKRPSRHAAPEGGE